MAKRRRRRTPTAVPGAVCKECVLEGVKTKRPAPYPGPRCYTHDRKATSGRSAARKAAYVEKTYSITEEQYQQLLSAQNGVCYICHRKPGYKRLSVDHDHQCCPGKISCGKCVRGLLCKGCNRDILGHVRDDPAALRRGADYLENPPAYTVLGLRGV